MMDFPLTLIPILKRAGTLFPKREIVTRLPDKSLHRYNYNKFYSRAAKLASALKSAGLERGQRVATLMWNSYVHLEVYFGVPCAGGVLHTLNFRLHENDIAYIVNHAKDRFLIVDDTLLPVLERISPNVNFERIFVVSLSDLEVPSKFENYEDFLESGDKNFSFPNINENDACGICYTSGTTGKPKGVVYSHRAMVLHTFCSGLVDTIGLQHRDVLMPVVPMFHVNAWGLPYSGIMMGSKLVLPGPFMDAKNLLELCESEQITLAAGVPTIWMEILQALESEPQKWTLSKNLRTIIGGSAVPESMIRGFDRHDITIIHAWGMTEMTPIGTVSRLKVEMDCLDINRKYELRAKQGIPVPFVEVRAVNDKGVIKWDGKTVGELQVRGPWVAADYFDSDQTNDKWTEDGWFCTGDVVVIDKEGYVKIADRTKDLIKSGGEWISSVDLENALMGHESILEAAVIAVPHPKWTERPLAIVVLTKGATQTKEVLNNYLSQRFAKWWLPDAYEFTDKIPRTSTGKFFKTKLRDIYSHKYKNY